MEKKGINCVRWSLFCTSIDSIQDDVLSLKSTIKFRPNSKIIMWSGVRVATQSTNGIQKIGTSGEKRIIPSKRNRYLIGSIEFRSLLLISIENHWHNNDFNRYFAPFIRFFFFSSQAWHKHYFQTFWCSNLIHIHASEVFFTMAEMQ